MSTTELAEAASAYLEAVNALHRHGDDNSDHDPDHPDHCAWECNAVDQRNGSLPGKRFHEAVLTAVEIAEAALKTEIAKIAAQQRKPAAAAHSYVTGGLHEFAAGDKRCLGCGHDAEYHESEVEEIRTYLEVSTAYQINIVQCHQCDVELGLDPNSTHDYDYDYIYDYDHPDDDPDDDDDDPDYDERGRI